MNKDQHFIVRGSGYGIDSTVVVVTAEHEVDGEKYLSVRPATPRHVGEKSVLIHERYLQPISDRLKKYIYTFTVTKRCVDDGTTEQDLLVIDGAVRNMKVATILARLNMELGPILRGD